MDDDDTTPVGPALGSLSDAEAPPEPGTPAAAGAPDWSWSPAVDDDAGPARPVEPDASEAAVTEPPDADKAGPSPADAVQITALAPDPDPAAAAGEAERPEPATPVGDLAPADGAGDEEARAGDDATAGEDEDGSDDFQAWLERNSV